MISTGITQESFLTAMEVKLNANYTDEQKELILSFGDGPVFCFADPGTGKTFTAIGGLINAELFKGIPGDKIYALSFTRLATGELAVRHKNACTKLGISDQVNFATLHALCRSILKENYRLLGMSKFDSTGALTMEKAYSIVESTMEEWGIELNPNQIKACINAARSLNASLIFDQDNIESKMAFKKCKVDYEIFDKVRGLLFAYSLVTETISVSDLLLYTVMLMTKHPEVSQQFKEKCKLMLVDEAQDLSLLQLKVISLLTDNPVFIGDMKQQIYAFNGACQEVVEAFGNLYPGYKRLQLTRSFRCHDEIADYATQIIKYNNVGGEDYKGIGPGGVVDRINGEIDLDLDDLCSKIKDDFLSNGHRFSQDYMFLTRSNISLIPIMEELYKKGLPFRTNKFQPAYSIPVIKELCELVQLCANPATLTNIMALRYLIPEFRGYYNLYQHPYYMICKECGCNIFEVNYEFKDMGIGSAAMMLLSEVANMVDSNCTIGEIFNKLWPMYESNWIKYIEWRLESQPDYYIKAIYSLTRKTYANFIADEVKKEEIVEDSERHSRGVRCYTMHASKGLEADVVYIMDANEGMIPNMSELNKMVKAGCDMDAARQIREERSLCYVACTRAKKELHIVYTKEMASILNGINTFSSFDDVYKYYKSSGDDIRAFEKFVERYINID